MTAPARLEWAINTIGAVSTDGVTLIPGDSTPALGPPRIEYQSQSARDAQASGYGGFRYWDYLEEAALRTRGYYLSHGNHEQAEEMMVRSLGEALRGNDGD